MHGLLWRHRRAFGRRLRIEPMGIINIVNGILWRDGKLLLAKRSALKTSYANKWSFPGGHVEHGENLKEALARELKEELAVSLADCELIAEIDDPNSTSANLVRYHIFLVTDWGTGEPIIMNLRVIVFSMFPDVHMYTVIIGIILFFFPVSISTCL
jgi:mutator protein MutT